MTRLVDICILNHQFLKGVVKFAVTKAHHLLPNSDERIISQMLKEMGINSVDALFNDVPQDLILKNGLRLPKAMSEDEVERHVEELLSRNLTYPAYLCFLGGGVWPHYVPAAVDEIVSRSEFYTSYTPYQAEISQGMLQALFEYQSLICELTSMDVANSSLYDWPTALGEAARMAARVTKKRKVIVPRNASPERIDVLKTYCEPVGIEVKVINYKPTSGQVDLEAISQEVDQDVAAVYVENPNFFGIFEEEVAEISEISHRSGALFITGVDPISLGLVKPPGDYGADIVVSEGQPLGLHLNFGGPLLGILAVKEDSTLLRQMPGRIIGETTSKEGGRRGFVMVLQTREQHIRREAATSNICTNQALCGLAAAVYLSLLGPEGLKDVGRKILLNSHYVASLLSEIKGIASPYFSSPFFKEFTLSTPRLTPENLSAQLLEHKIIGGLSISHHYPELPNVSLITVTEIHTRRDIERLVEAVRMIVGGR